jgi:hypothetical protein
VSRRPIPPHGTYARANGSPGYRKACGCEPCLTARRRHKKHNTVMRQLGRPAKVDATQARQRLLLLHQTTGWNDLAVAVGGSASNLRDIAFGRRNPIRRTTHDKIMAVSVEPSGGQYIDAAGSRRRIQALRAIGWSCRVIAERAATSEARVQLIANGQLTIRHGLANKIRNAYVILAAKPAPVDRNTARVRACAARNEWAPPGAWNDDEIDDPNAHPDWTGHCGTDRGWWTHTTEGIPVCGRCQTAHTTWLADRKQLAPAERFRQLALAKGAASQRGANIAADARELMRISGLSYEQVSERLGVSTNHIQQELLRHPERMGEAA